MPTPYTLATGLCCRSWDDFLTASAQNWSALLGELVSGRLDTYLHAIGRDDLRPSSASFPTPDERLDDWLGRLPTTRSAEPELEVHPTVVRVRAVPGGGLTRTKVVVTNTGYRLLRSRLRVEPPGTVWVRLATEAITTAETTEVPLAVEIPESLDSPRSCIMAIESNGGSRRVEIRLEPPPKPEIPAGPVEEGEGVATASLAQTLQGVGLTTRIVWAVLGACALRILVSVGDRLSGLLGLGGAVRPALGGVAVLGALLGAAAGWLFARRRGEPRDRLPAAFTAGFSGILVAALAVAVARTFEPASGWRLLVGLVVWAVLAALLGLGSLALFPRRLKADEGSQT
jgi:hypothetical protein